jgi:hypothetical protein
MTDLQDAVNELTQPIIEHMAQIGDDGKWIRTHTVEHPPLLHQLENAVKPSSTVTGPGTPALPSERSPIDLNMLLEFAKISSEIRSWCRIRKVEVTHPPRGDAVVDLRAWGADAAADETLEGTFYIRTLRRWVTLIQGFLRPAETFEADYPCPICGASAWGEYINGGSTRAILVSYQKDDDGRIFDERAFCRPCQTVWEGHASVMELAEEQHEARRIS